MSASKRQFDCFTLLKKKKKKGFLVSQGSCSSMFVECDRWDFSFESLFNIYSKGLEALKRGRDEKKGKGREGKGEGS